MKGILKTGEIITLIDDVDTRGMSAADVNQVMADKVGKEKILAVWSSTKVMSSSVKSSEVPKVTKKAAESSQKPAAAVVAAAPVTATVANFTPKYGEERRVVVGPGKLGIVIDTTAGTYWETWEMRPAEIALTVDVLRFTPIFSTSPQMGQLFTRYGKTRLCEIVCVLVILSERSTIWMY